MNTLVKSIEKTLATEVWFSDEKLFVRLADGRELGVPLFWFPKLQAAAEKSWNNWRLIGKGRGIHWEDLDEGLSVSGLFKFSD